jgi:hypothetical protein
MMRRNFLALAASARCRSDRAGSSDVVISIAAAMCMAVGKLSFDDWLMLT